MKLDQQYLKDLLIAFEKTRGPDTMLSEWICPYISRHLLSLNPLQARCRRYSRGER
ncbi:Transcriptional regulator [Escherichia coli]